MKQETLKKVLWYEPETGVFRWRNAPTKSIRPWTVAGCKLIKGAAGIAYTYIRINKKSYQAHRLAFVYMQGLDIDDDWIVDHVDGNGMNNSWSNIRLATYKQNSENTRMNKNNTSGYRGVYFDKLRQLWVALINHNKKCIYLGKFKNKEDAAKAYEAAREKLFTYNENRHLKEKT